MVFKFSDSISWQEIHSGNFIYIFEHKSKKEYYLEEVSMKVWLFINEGKSYNAILQELNQMYEVELSILKNDLEELLINLIDKNLIKEKNE